MKITKLVLLEETEKHYLIGVNFKVRTFNFLGIFRGKYKEIHKHIIRDKNDMYSTFADNGEYVFNEFANIDNTIDFFIKSKQSTLDIF